MSKTTRVEEALINMIETLEFDLNDALYEMEKYREEVEELKGIIKKQTRTIEVLESEIRYLKYYKNNKEDK